MIYVVGKTRANVILFHEDSAVKIDVNQSTQDSCQAVCVLAHDAAASCVERYDPCTSNIHYARSAICLARLATA